MIIYFVGSLLVFIAITPIILKFIELSKWFNRKSQHYIMGNWLEYVRAYDWYTGRWNAVYFKYIIGYPKAWCLFMWYSRKEILTA